MLGKNSIDYLCIGFFCHDVLEDGYILGGTASYSSIIAQSLGKNVGVLTSVGEDFQFHKRFLDLEIQVINKLAKATTVFENVYDDNGERTQYLHQRAHTLNCTDVPSEWKQAPIVQVCPIADEVDFSLLSYFPNSLIGATIQGWLRSWNEEGKVSPKSIDWSLLQPIEIVILSDDDIKGFENAIEEMAEIITVLVVTHGADGASVYNKGEHFHYPSFQTSVVDATGAGDVFATAFLIQYAKTRNIALSTGFAHSAASIIVEGLGMQNLTKLSETNDRFEMYCNRFLSQP